MKKRLLAAVSFAALVSCSAPKYTYFNYSSRSVNSAKAGEVKAEMRESRGTALNSSSAVHEEDLVVSTSKRIVPGNGQGSLARPVVDKGSGTFKPELTRTRKGGLNGFREYVIKASPDSVKEGSKYKNGFAIAGFILVFTPVIWWIGAFTQVGFAIGIVGFVSGIILSALGLRSKKRGFAIAGLIIGIVEAVLLAALYVILSTAYTH